MGPPRNRIPDPTAAGDSTKSATTDQSFSESPQPTPRLMPSPTSSPRPPASLTARSAPLPDLAEILRGQHAAKLDAITQARNLHADGGLLRVAGADHAPTIDGVTGPTPGRHPPRPRMPASPTGGVAPATDRARAAPLMDLPPAHEYCARARRGGGPVAAPCRSQPLLVAVQHEHVDEFGQTSPLVRSVVTGFGPTRPATFDGGKRRRDRR